MIWYRDKYSMLLVWMMQNLRVMRKIMKIIGTWQHKKLSFCTLRVTPLRLAIDTNRWLAGSTRRSSPGWTITWAGCLLFRWFSNGFWLFIFSFFGGTTWIPVHITPIPCATLCHSFAFEIHVWDDGLWYQNARNSSFLFFSINQSSICFRR